MGIAFPSFRSSCFGSLISEALLHPSMLGAGFLKQGLGKCARPKADAWE